MTTHCESIVTRFLASLHDAGEPDWQTMGSLLADDAYYHTLVPARDKVRGRDGILAELKSQFRLYRDCRCELMAIAAKGYMVLTERRDKVIMLANDLTGFDHEFEIVVSVMGAFEVKGDRIVAWRDYWDPADIAAQVRHNTGTQSASLAGSRDE